MAQGLTGIEATTTRLKAIRANISNIARTFNIQEGLRPEDDRLPSRLHKEALKSGHQISKTELEKMVADYYRLRGWDKHGKPKADRVL
jgi:aldehyde:ferredoxin oxidoreductase